MRFEFKVNHEHALLSICLGLGHCQLDDKFVRLAARQVKFRPNIIEIDVCHRILAIEFTFRVKLKIYWLGLLNNRYVSAVDGDVREYGRREYKERVESE